MSYFTTGKKRAYIKMGFLQVLWKETMRQNHVIFFACYVKRNHALKSRYLIACFNVELFFFCFFYVIGREVVVSESADFRGGSNICTLMYCYRTLI